MSDILVLHGPNLNLLGKREPETYGSATLAEINQMLSDLAEEAKVGLDCYQSNSEGELVTRIQRAPNEEVKFIVINAASLTHSSIALRDALKFAAVPFIEVHLSNVFAREEFRHKSYLADFAVGVISGCGANSYVYALRQAIYLLKKT